jgi:hypothetical protein
MNNEIIESESTPDFSKLEIIILIIVWNFIYLEQENYFLINLQIFKL